ncbi:MAG: lipoate--protein ligase family protein [Candidatus Nezhaarchaeota archaeon]|nr:lipoate--protein ligase family protein [Candidatus Nezhaarchaeota archaeon]
MSSPSQSAWRHASRKLSYTKHYKLLSAIASARGTMVERWRLLKTGAGSAYWNMAVDEAMLKARAQGRAPCTVRLYAWRPSAVSIGFFQSLRHEVNLDECRRLGVDVVRRITGGGAVYHDSRGEVTYSVVASEEDLRRLGLDAAIQPSYEALCGGIIEGLKLLGVSAEFRPINDIVVSGRKISGSAQTRRAGVILQHGTLLLKSDIATMFKVLKVSKEKVSDKAIKAVEERVTNVFKELGREIELNEVIEALVKGFEKSLGVKLVEGELTPLELSLAEELKEKYASREWLELR